MSDAMTDEDLVEIERVRRKRTVAALAGDDGLGVRAAPPLRGLGWGLVVAIVVTVIVFASVLVAAGRNQRAANQRPAGAAAVPTATAAARPAGGPAGLWSFAEGSGGTAADGSGHGRPLLLRGGTTWATGHKGPALAFDGRTGEADTPAAVLDTTGSFTVAAWVRLDDLSIIRTAVSQAGPHSSAFFLQYLPDGRVWSFSALEKDGVTPARALGTAAVRPRTWHHLVGVRDARAGELRLYVDGVRQAVTRYALPVPPGGPLTVGAARYHDQTVDHWAGLVDEAVSYPGALDDTDVDALFRS